jgi:hypothetical protein
VPAWLAAFANTQLLFGVLVTLSAMWLTRRFKRRKSEVVAVQAKKGRQSDAAKGKDALVPGTPASVV